ncbi:MAG TPA: NAD(P)/FAD-dependent oxidoreductase, partial [Chondromyces sp.]|nr:NAD(P)/FAD-dependent oxidoreductase [Chondromyces sp.]
DAEDGRSTICRSYHNILGYPDGVSGQELREIGKEHAKRYGIDFLKAKVTDVEKNENGFTVYADEVGYEARCLLFSTGVMDRLPSLPNLAPCLGISVYVCPDCDGYEVKGKRTIVMGSGQAGANMALTLGYWTNDIVFINHEQEKVNPEILERLEENRIEYIEEPIEKVLEKDSMFQGVTLRNGAVITGERGFVALGGNEVKSALPKKLGVEVMDNKHIKVDPRTKMTNVPNIWAAGDVVAHSEQVTIAMGDGSQAAIWIHKTLLQAY